MIIMMEESGEVPYCIFLSKTDWTVVFSYYDSPLLKVYHSSRSSCAVVERNNDDYSCYYYLMGLSGMRCGSAFRNSHWGFIQRLLFDALIPALVLQALIPSCFGPACVVNVGAANWAQVVGEQRQNTVTPAKAQFTPRWGHAAVNIDTTVGLNVLETLMVMGGDTIESFTQDRKIVSQEVRCFQMKGGEVRI